MGTHAGNVITLANSIIGVSVLAMPFCFKQCGIILSILMLLFSNIISRLSCHYLMKSAIMEKRKNFEMLAFRAFGPTGKLTVELCIIGFMLGTCIAYFVIMGDLGPGIVGPLFGFQHPTALRPSVLIAIAIFVVLPLGLLKNVDSLSGVCAATVAFYACLVLKVLGEAVEHLVTADWIDKVYYWRPSGILQCIPIFSMALSCQTQLFEIFDSPPSTPLDRMNSVVRSATNMVTMFYISVGFFGYIAYCDQSFSGNLMMNFSKTLTSEVIKIGFLMSVAVSFPLVIFPCRASIHSLLFSKGYEHAQTGSAHIPESRFQCITLVIVTLALVIGLLIPNIELVLGLVGSTIGVVVCVVVPAVIFISLSSKNNNERLLAKLLVLIGLVIMVLGTYANLFATEEAISKPDMKPLLSDSIPNPILPKVVIKDETLEKLNNINELAAALPNLKSESKISANQQRDILKETVVNKGNIIESKEVKKEPPVPEEPVPIKKEIKIHKLELPLKDVLSITNTPKENNIPKVVIPMKVDSIGDNSIKEEEKNILDFAEQPQKLEKEVVQDSIIEKEKDNTKNIESKKKEKKKEKLIERIKEHQKAQEELLAKGEELINELKNVVNAENRTNDSKDANLNKNVPNAKSVGINAKELTASEPKREEKKLEPGKPEENPVHEDPIVVSMAKGIPLPLAVKGKVQMVGKEKEETKLESEVEKVGRDILGGDPMELREKRDVKALNEMSHASGNDLSGQVTSPQRVKAPMEVVKKTSDVKEEPNPARDVTVEEGSCVKNGSLHEENKKKEVVKPEAPAKSIDKLQDPLIKFSSHLSDPKPILNESPQLLDNKADSIIAEMPKRRDLKSIETNDVDTNHRDR